MTEPEPPRRRVLMCVSGAAAALTIPSYLLSLAKSGGYDVTTVLSPSAAQFLNPQAIAHLGSAMIDGSDQAQVFAHGHMALASRAELVVIAPASAATISAVAHGLGHELIPLIVLSTQAPVVMFPSMHITMWNKKAMQRNVAAVRADSYRVHEHWAEAVELSDGSVAEHVTLPGVTRLLKVVRSELGQE